MTAHSKNRAEAIKLIEFLTTLKPSSSSSTRASSTGQFQAAVSPILVKWGKFKQDDTNVAAAGEFQAAATRLADRVGYK